MGREHRHKKTVLNAISKMKGTRWRAAMASRIASDELSKERRQKPAEKMRKIRNTPTTASISNWMEMLLGSWNDAMNSKFGQRYRIDRQIWRSEKLLTKDRTSIGRAAVRGLYKLRVNRPKTEPNTRRFEQAPHLSFSLSLSLSCSHVREDRKPCQICGKLNLSYSNNNSCLSQLKVLISYGSTFWSLLV